MIVLGILLILLGLLLPGKLGVLFIIGIICLVVGLALLALGGAGRPVGGRRHYW